MTLLTPKHNSTQPTEGTDTMPLNDDAETLSVNNAPMKVSTPSVTVFGCGGCGINLSRLVKGDLAGRAVMKYIDTSHANLRSGEDAYIITSGSGAGKVRVDVAGPITNELMNMSDDDLPVSDINIVVFAGAGGSGSVIAPIAIREIERRGGKTVAFMVIDTISELDALNSLNTIKSLEVICQSKNIYLPISIFDNAVVSRDIVNTSLSNRLINLIQLLTCPTLEVDRNDRRNFLNGIKTITAAPGLRKLHVTVGENGNDEDASGEYFTGYNNVIFDSVLSIRTDADSVSIPVRSRVRYDGIFTTLKLKPILGVIGNRDDEFEIMIKNINDTLNSFSAKSKNYKPSISVSASEISSDHNDLVL